MNLYRKMHNEFFLATAILRHRHGVQTLCLYHMERGKWLTEDEIEDFTLAYMAGGEL